MSEGSNNIVPKIAITAYESNEEDIEVTNLFNAVNKKRNMIKTKESRSVSPSPIRHKSRIILKSPITTNLQRSLTPGVSDLNRLTDVEVMSDSDDEKSFIRTPNLTPGPIDYFILTDVEDLSEDEEHKKYNDVKEEQTDTENFIDDKGICDEIEYIKQPFEKSSYFPQPHREILFHSKDGKISALSPTEELDPIWLKSTNEEIKGFKSEEEIITAEDCKETELWLKNNDTYYHDIDVGVEESIETIKNERCKHKNRNRVLTTKKIAIPEIESGKKRFRNKHRCNSEVEESFEKRSEKNKNKTLLKYTTVPTLDNAFIPPQIQNNEMNKSKHQEFISKFVIHDNRNGFSISIDFESHNSVLLNVGRDHGYLSLKWFNNGITSGRIIYDHSNLNILAPLEPGCFINSSLYDPKQQFEIDLFTYGTMKTLQNKYFTCITVYTVVRPVNIVQLYINKPFQARICMVKNPLVKVYSLKDKFMNTDKLYPSPVSRLLALKIFNQKENEKRRERKQIKFQSEKHVSDVIDIFESMCDSPKLGRKSYFKKLSNADTNLMKYNCIQQHDTICIKNTPRIGNY